MGLFGNTTPQQATQQPQQAAQQPPQPMWDPNKAVASADPQGDRDPWIVQGVYPLLAVDYLKWHNQQDTGTTFFIARFQVVQSNVPDRPAGTWVSFTRNMTKRGSPGEVRTFVATLAGMPVDGVDENVMRQIMDESKNPAHGRLIFCEAFDKPMKSAPDKMFTVCRWQPVPEETQKRSAELRKDAGFDVPF